MFKLFYKKEKSKPLNLYQYKFMRFKRERDRLYPLDLSKVHIEEEKGLISVILPVYNGADMVGESIESVLNQTYKNFELIIVNDGSKDNTLEVLKSYEKKDERIKVYDQENRKIPRTLSRGFSLARGEFFTWTSADNIMLPTFLEKMMGELLKNPDAGMVFGNMRLINERGKVYKNHGWFEKPLGSGKVILPDTTFELNTYANNTIGASFMYRKKAYEALGCYSSFKHTLEDYDYWMRMNSLFSIIHTSFKEHLYLYRWHKGSLTAKDKELGITKNRYKLMLLDDARRDFYMTPLLWYIKGENQIRKDVEDELLKRGHIVLTDDDLNKLYFGEEAHNLVFLTFDGEDANLPKGTQKVSYGTEKDGFINVNEKMGGKGYFFSDTETMVSFLDAKIKNDLLYSLEEKIETEEDFKKEHSFILCTHRMSDVLKECMYALINQSIEKEKYEIVFVNNNFKDESIKEYVDGLKKEYPDTDINYITAPVKGLSHARNAGLWEAKGKVVHYIDDDAISDINLAKETVKAFKNNPDAGIIGGNIILEVPKGKDDVVTEITRPLWSERIIEGDKYFPAKDYGDFPYGANFAADKKTLMQIGGFRTFYGRVGDNYAGGEETLVCFMVGETEKEVGLCPLMKVTHKVDEGRFNKEHIKNTAYQGLLTQYRLRRDLYAPQDWNDMNIKDRRKKAESMKLRAEKQSPDYILYEATEKAYEDIQKNRQKDYGILSTAKKITDLE